jgi:ABC-type Fe3+/spermidine/putrescine transport system ATPase subunit
VEKNVEYGLKTRGTSVSERKEKVGRALEIVRMADAGRKLPNQLSGGQQQRVALARALVIEPDVLLLDEPLSNLDAKLRLEMREEVKRIHRETGVTALYVTHDQKEALSIADRLAVMREGRIEQVGAPEEVYNHPANAFVSGFIGETNSIPCEVIHSRPDEVQLSSRWGNLFSSKPHDHLPTEAKVVASVRPEAIRVESGGVGPNPAKPATLLLNYLPASVKAVTYLGDQQQYVLSLTPDLEMKASVLHPDTRTSHRVGDEVALVIDRADVAVFADDKVTG